MTEQVIVADGGAVPTIPMNPPQKKNPPPPGMYHPNGQAPRLMGHGRAFELLVMGKPLSGEEARACGLINQVALADQVEAEAMKAAQAIAALPPEGVAISRRLMKGAPDDVVRRIDDE